MVTLTNISKNSDTDFILLESASTSSWDNLLLESGDKFLKEEVDYDFFELKTGRNTVTPTNITRNSGSFTNITRN